METCCLYEEPLAGRAEQVFYHDLAAGPDGRVEVRLVNPGFAGGRGLGVVLRYRKEQYPVLVQWKSMRAGTYAAGLEPANCHVEGRVAERRAGTLQTIQPREIREFSVEVELIQG